MDEIKKINGGYGVETSCTATVSCPEETPEVTFSITRLDAYR